MNKLRTARGGLAATLALLFVLAVAGSSLGRRQVGHPGRPRRDAQVQGPRTRPSATATSSSTCAPSSPVSARWASTSSTSTWSATPRSTRSGRRCSSTRRRARAAPPRRRRVRHLRGRPDGPRPADELGPGRQPLRPRSVLRQACLDLAGEPQGAVRRLEPEHHLPRRRATTAADAADLAAAARRPGPRGSGRFAARCSRAARREATVCATAATVATQAAISARRLAPSLARMCSTCALTVFGETNSSPAISALVMPVGDLARHLELADGQRTPGFVLEFRGRGRRAPARRLARASGSLPSRRQLSRTSAMVVGRIGVSVHPHQAAGEIEASPRRLPRPAAFLPAADRTLERLARRRQRASCQPAQAVGMARCAGPPPCPSPPGGSRARETQRSASSGRVARRCTHARRSPRTE